MCFGNTPTALTPLILLRRRLHGAPQRSIARPRSRGTARTRPSARCASGGKVIQHSKPLVKRVLRNSETSFKKSQTLISIQKVITVRTLKKLRDGTDAALGALHERREGRGVDVRGHVRERVGGEVHDDRAGTAGVVPAGTGSATGTENFCGNTIAQSKTNFNASNSSIGHPNDYRRTDFT